MTRILLSTALIASAATAGFAGSPEPAPVEPMVSQPIAVTPAPTGGDWTGPYVGLSFGNLSADADDFDDSETIYGLHGGYDYDFGQFVIGGELDYQTGEDIELGGIEVDDVFRAKLRGGYDLGRALVYGTVGAAQLNANVGDDTGLVGGLGVEYKVTEQFTVGGEYLAHRFEDFDDSGIDVDADTISIRGSFRF
ncbi:outer membrane protein [Marivita hallyeonensis]|uniref:Outer membrane autotransporter barrel domain-containing protein n=1 Tax=Marivita hallyeonensis TaxID=996342 RepID=A0A1M5QRF9_9RHOB|nr:outer membrane beta-barrel protein [Marivita hallyeonensis]SHH16360.1 outer membrane autotransporter barrel domain-containing protein [Marivita hallyeonensis]